jgi:hypothetical protein
MAALNECWLALRFPSGVFTDIYIEALLVDEELAGQVWAL